MAGLIGYPANTPYAAVKAAIVTLSYSLRVEAEAYGVKVNVVCPGYVETEIFSASRVVQADKDRLQHRPPFKTLSAEAAAKIILAGVAKNKPAIVFPRYARMIWRLHRLNPQFLLPLGRKVIAASPRQAAPHPTAKQAPSHRLAAPAGKRSPPFSRTRGWHPTPLTGVGWHRFLNRWAEGQKRYRENLDFSVICMIPIAPRTSSRKPHRFNRCSRYPLPCVSRAPQGSARHRRNASAPLSLPVANARPIRSPPPIRRPSCSPDSSSVSTIPAVRPPAGNRKMRPGEYRDEQEIEIDDPQ